MKITFITPFNQFTGGIGVVRDYTKWLNEHGHDCRIMFPAWENPMGCFKSTPYTSGYLSESQIPDADVIIATSWETAYIVNRQPERKGKKYYFIQHYEQWDWLNGGVGSHLVEDTYHMEMEHIYVSEYVRSLIIFSDTDGVIVHNGVDIPNITGKDYDTPIILYPSSNVRWKGNETLAPVLEKVRKEYPDIHIATYGLSWVPDISDLYKKANIFVFPSWCEGFGLPPLEAAAAGCAVVSTTTNAMPELFRDNEMVWVPPKDGDKLYAAICELVENRERRVILGTKARVTASHYTKERAAQEFEKAITQ